MPLYDRIASLAAEDAARPVLVECDEAGAPTRTVTRGELLAFVHKARAEAAREPLVMEGAATADFLLRCWAAWAIDRTVVPLDGKRDTDELRAYKTAAAARATAEDALILFTSGTTAHPKGACLSLENLLTNAQDIAQWLRITKDDCFLVQLPLYHINSITFSLASLISGARIALTGPYSASRFWELAAQTGATLTSVVPSILYDQLSRTSEFETHRGALKLSRIQVGSAPVVVSDVQLFMRRFHIPLYQGYGQTETALRVTGVPTDLPTALYERAVAENSIGTPMPWATVEIMNEAGSILGEQEEGELVVKGKALMRGYAGGEAAFRDGWFLTGDVGYWRMVEGRRFFYLKGRSKEIIIKGGVNISPVAVEDALKKLDPQVDQAYVVGVPDERYGEEVGAAIVWRPGVDAKAALRRLKLMLLLGTPHISEYESPRFVRTLESQELPMTSTGKAQRSVLKANIAGTLEPVGTLYESAEFRFEIITPHSPLATASHELYNRCWQPLIKSENDYKKYLNEHTTLAAVAHDGSLAGEISFDYKNNTLVCISICSANFVPKPIPEVASIPSPEFVREYVVGGNDPVMNFHTTLGAELVELIQNGRPEDKSSLGYTMLLRYPKVSSVEVSGSAAQQLIKVVRLLAADIDAGVEALSRPGGLSAHLSTMV